MFLDYTKYGNEDKLLKLVDAFKSEFGDLNKQSISEFRKLYKNNIEEYNKNNKWYDIDFIDGNGYDSDWWLFKLYDTIDNSRIDPYTVTQFSKTIEIASSLPHVKRILYSSLGPGNDVPPHIDDEDDVQHEKVDVVNFNITVHANGGISFRAGEETVNPTVGSIYCLDSYHTEHAAANIGDDHWVILILQIERSFFL